MKTLKRTQFGDPVLRQVAHHLTAKEVKSAEIQKLIKHMRETLTRKKLGVGLAAPQVGKSLALAVIKIQPMEHRPDVEPFEMAIINPEITEYVGRKKSLWEGCISTSSSGKPDLFAKVPRYNKIKIKYRDETFEVHHKTFEGLRAQIIQHEVDHLNGVLFVDKVKNTQSYMTYHEYMKRVKKLKNKSCYYETMPTPSFQSLLELLKEIT